MVHIHIDQLILLREVFDLEQKRDVDLAIVSPQKLVKRG